MGTYASAWTVAETGLCREEEWDIVSESTNASNQPSFCYFYLVVHWVFKPELMIQLWALFSWSRFGARCEPGDLGVERTSLLERELPPGMNIIHI